MLARVEINAWALLCGVGAADAERGSVGCAINGDSTGRVAADAGA
jgi:hypothetical protein